MEQRRQPKGTTIGGQLAQSKNSESNLDLGDGSYSETDEFGTTWYLNSDGQRHRDGGLPAIERADGTKEYYVNDRRHNAHGPAVITARGAREYWLEGRRVLKAEWESHPDVIAAKKSGDSANELPSESA